MDSAVDMGNELFRKWWDYELKVGRAKRVNLLC